VIPLLLGLGLLLNPQAQPATHVQPVQRAVEIHELFSAPNGAVLSVLNGQRGYELGRVDPLPVPITMWRSAVPMGPGTWIELLTREYVNMGAFRSPFPAPGERCGIEVPLLPGTWWVLLLHQVNNQNQVLARFEVGPKLARLAQKLNRAANPTPPTAPTPARLMARPRPSSPAQPSPPR